MSASCREKYENGSETMLVWISYVSNRGLVPCSLNHLCNIEWNQFSTDYHKTEKRVYY